MKRFLLFGLAGVIVTFSNLGVFWLALQFSFHYMIALVLATIAAILASFFTSEYLVFTEGASIRSRSSRFIANAVYVAADALIRAPLLAVGVEVFHLDPLLVQFLLTGVLFFGKFFIFDKIVYKKSILEE